MPAMSIRQASRSTSAASIASASRRGMPSSQPRTRTRVTTSPAAARGCAPSVQARSRQGRTASLLAGAGEGIANVLREMEQADMGEAIVKAQVLEPPTADLRVDRGRAPGADSTCRFADDEETPFRPEGADERGAGRRQSELRFYELRKRDMALVVVATEPAALDHGNTAWIQNGGERTQERRRVNLRHGRALDVVADVDDRDVESVARASDELGTVGDNQFYPRIIKRTAMPVLQMLASEIDQLAVDIDHHRTLDRTVAQHLPQRRA